MSPNQRLIYLLNQSLAPSEQGSRSEGTTVAEPEASDDESKTVEVLSSMKVTSASERRDASSDSESSGDEDERQATGVPRESLYDEFVSMMEERFLSGKDEQFFDYSAVDNSDQSKEFQRIREQDMEDAYFADSD